MIFDCKHVTDLVENWKTSGDVTVLEEIMIESTPLVEVIVSRYPIDNREDMIQECLMRMSFALGHFDTKISNLHTYLTSVFVNRCNSYIGKESRERELANALEEMYAPVVFSYDQREDFLHDLLERNRKRFPTIQTDKLDDSSCFVFDCIVNGIHGKSRGAIANMMTMYGFKRNIATVIYHSSLVYMRQRYENFVSCEADDPKEFTLLPELKNILGEEAYRRVSILFSGLYFRIP